MKKLLVGLVTLSLVLAGCGSKNVSDKPEKERFISATAETACMFFEDPDVSKASDKELEDKTKAIFEKYGFDVNDDKAMEEISAKYENDPDLEKEVTAALEECAGDLMDAFENLGGGDGAATEPVVEPTDVEAVKSEDATI